MTVITHLNESEIIDILRRHYAHLLGASVSDTKCHLVLDHSVLKAVMESKR